MNDERKPVWAAFPKIPWGSIGWRMGPGEDYWHAWVPWFKEQSVEARASFKGKWPEPEGWEGFYAFVETGAKPPWLLERQARSAAAAIPPAPDETEITEYHRILWLIRQHMKSAGHEHPGEDEALVELFAAPDGSRWRLSAALKGGMLLKRLS
jgi:hypothetical protein